MEYWSDRAALVPPEKRTKDDDEEWDITPSLHYSTTPLLHYCTTPSLHHPTTPPLHQSINRLAGSLPVFVQVE
jgi:hypothetical protein